MEKKVVYMERMKESSLVVQALRIYDVWRKFARCMIYIDATSIGGALVDDLQRHPNAIPSHKIEPIQFNNKNKTEMIGRLRADIEHMRIKIPHEMKVLIDELSVYAQEYNPRTGTVKYSAPGRKHDDTVIALALATIREDVEKCRYLGRVARMKLGF
jgi:phage FluMu gp28-like protein